MKIRLAVFEMPLADKRTYTAQLVEAFLQHFVANSPRMAMNLITDLIMISTP
jgi:hypothetical protein